MTPYLPATLLTLALLASAPPSEASNTALRASLQHDLNQYLSARATVEHLSAISLSVSLHGRSENVNVTAGRTRFANGGMPVTPGDLWQIGSNTKAFTATAILQLEAERKLTIDQTVGRWLPQYPAWKNVTIRHLLDMTSGIPTYDAVPAMLAAFAKNPKRNFTIPELVAYVYPTNPHAPPPTTGYSYSNTNYLLAELIIERVTGRSYASEIERRFFTPLGLRDTYYSETSFPRSVTDRMVAGYFFNREPDVAPLAPLLGTDVRENSVSWLRAAGGIVSTPEDLVRWARALYTGPLLAAKQRAELLRIVSLKTGKPIAQTSLSDPRGFGLGVVQLTDAAMKGTVWFYEGDTMGYRMVYVYCPHQDAVFAFALNSQPDSQQNQSGKLVESIYKTLLAAGFK